MKYVLLFLLSIGLLVLGQEVLGQETQTEEASEKNCALIENARERLTCYDRTFPIGIRAPLPQISSEVIAAPQARDSQTSSAVPQVQAPTTAVDDTPATASPTDEWNSSGMFSSDDYVEFTATVNAVRDKGQQRMVFLLDNGQIWMQSSPRSVPIRQGDSVTVKSGKIGGYIMRSENKVSTRVHRIK
jgi:hypothetical protein